MGGEISTNYPIDTQYGCHVLKVQNNSPGEKAGLVPYFDFILTVNDITLTNENIKEVLTKFLNTEITMQVFSSKSRSCKIKKTLLSSDWGGSGLLGVSIRYCTFKGACENVWHVLEIEKHSPASFAGLVSNTDYILGSDVLLDNCSAFNEFIEANDGKVVKLYVYSSVNDECREVSVTPNSKWGGEGLLGCGIGYGYLHRIPLKNEDIEEAQEQSLKIKTQNYNISKESISQEETSKCSHSHHEVQEASRSGVHSCNPCMENSSAEIEIKPDNESSLSILGDFNSVLNPGSSVNTDSTHVNNVPQNVTMNNYPQNNFLSNVALPGMPPLEIPINSVGQSNININPPMPPVQNVHPPSYNVTQSQNYYQNNMAQGSVMPPPYQQYQNNSYGNNSSYQTAVPMPNYSENINYSIPPTMNFNLPPTQYQSNYTA